MANNLTVNSKFYHDNLDYISFLISDKGLNNFSNTIYGNAFMNLITAFIPLYLRAGFILIQIGCTPTSNANLIIIQNIIDFAVATVSYCLIGSRLAFGEDIHGLIGNFYSKCADSINIDIFIYGWSTVIITTGIITTIFAGRMHAVAYVLLSFLTAGFLQPMFMHWIWDTNGILRNNVFQNYPISLIDNSGITSIHICGGIIAFIGNICFGRKLIRLRDLDRDYLASTPFIVIGYFLVISGLILNMVTFSTFYIKNIMLALSGGIIGTAVFMKLTKCNFEADEWLISRYMQGGILGMISISGGLFMYSQPTSFLIGTISSVLLVGQSKMVLTSAFDDYCLIVPVHLTGGFIGLILPTLFLCKNYLTMEIFFIQFGWQLIGFFSIVLTSIILILPLFCILKSLKLLRNESEQKHHNLAMSAAKEIPPQDFFKRLYKIPGRKFLEEGDVDYKNKNACFCTRYTLNKLDESQSFRNNPK